MPEPERLVECRAARETATARVCSRAEASPRRSGGSPPSTASTSRCGKGELRSVIGPNGAGKTTFFNLLTGVLPPSGGQILFKGEDITGRPAHAVSRLGIARSYQVTNIFGDLTVFENVRIAAQSRVPTTASGAMPTGSRR